MKRTPDQSQQIYEMIDRFGETDDPTVIMTRFSAYLSQFGFSSFLISNLPPQLQRIDPHILIDGWPPEWYERYNAKHYYGVDPVALRCFQTIAPFAWDELPPEMVKSRAARLVMDEAAEFGLAKGLSVPLHGLFEFQAIVTMAGRHVEVPPECRPLINLVSAYAYSAAARAAVKRPADDKRPTLTPRERDVISWVAEGKTTWEIGQILGIAESTAVGHLTQIRRKTGARSTAQALAEVLKRGELRL
ncbi:LuxR family transcriptional regulator [Microvirga antarctica]|uniref:LuxR family transcriptional regulator n=1 Tax=Microvirga antarctica TaxID=2819233 RepID=UPI001B3102A6|nr:LuxR family transcriptional regulator [Microvirga antarctica]